jgi:hypothetical protein
VLRGRHQDEQRGEQIQIDVKSAWTPVDDGHRRDGPKKENTASVTVC